MELQNAKGTKDFPPEEKILKNQIVDTFKKNFEKYGFAPLETPILERYETLSAKYGGGSEILKETFKLKDQGDRTLGLRFDLTVPLARFIGMNPTLKLPFKRYELGRVFRDGPIKLGRMREFWQCDIDVIGTKSMVAETEILGVVSDFFKELKLNTIIKINNRKLLNGILEQAGITKSKEDTILIIDKLAKIGEKGVKKELEDLGLTNEQIKNVLNLIKQKDLNKIKLTNQEGLEGLEELEELFGYLKPLKINFEFDPSLARGLAYYTGTVFEVFLKKGKITSSLAGGGRWDKMIGNYLGSNKEYPAVGISFGLEPITQSLKQEEQAKTPTQVFLIPIQTQKETMKIAQEFRKAGINTDLDITGRGISKNLNYANALNIPFVIFIGQEELKKNKLKLKDMKSGKEEFLTKEQIIKKLK
ncbi:histidine--tRNA ligase [Nanoarchaeota archaeon]